MSFMAFQVVERNLYRNKDDLFNLRIGLSSGNLFKQHLQYLLYFSIVILILILSIFQLEPLFDGISLVLCLGNGKNRFVELRQ